MNRFELNDKNFHDYNNGEIRWDIKPRKDIIYFNPFKDYDNRSDYELLGYLSNFLVQKDSSLNPELSFIFKLLRFLRHFKWSNKYYKSGGGNIPDRRYFAREIRYHLNKLTRVSYLSSHEIRQLISASLRVYHKNGWDEGTPLKLEDLHRCKNLQEFYTSEFNVDFKFAEKLQNLRVVDLGTNSADNKRGIVKFKNYEKRSISNLNYLKSCLVLNLQDSFVDNFSNIQENVLALSVKNSNFKDLESISKLKNLQYLDISDNQINSLEGVQHFKDLKVLNCCNIEFLGNEKSKLLFFTQLHWFCSLEILVMDSQLYEEYLQKSLNILPPENLVIIYNSYFPSVKMTSFDIINLFRIPDQINKKTNLHEINYDLIKKIFVKESN